MLAYAALVGLCVVAAMGLATGGARALSLMTAATLSSLIVHMTAQLLYASLAGSMLVKLLGQSAPCQKPYHQRQRRAVRTAPNRLPDFFNKDCHAICCHCHF